LNSSESSIRDLQILMYHRIAPPGLDPWRLRVTPDHFEQQLSALKARFEVISLAEIPHRQDFRNTVAITFDDGYADNLLRAKPILEEFETPATVFITTSYVNADREFWWDELEQLFLYPGVLPERLILNIGGLSFCTDIAEACNFLE
jgi:peptidoglycan/xylan/chitin deacetylase (PgdA/CDA1 family)